MSLIKYIILVYLIQVICSGCAGFKNKLKIKEDKRLPATDTIADYFSPREIKKSPFTQIRNIDYLKIKGDLQQYISSRPFSMPYEDQKKRYAWAAQQSSTNSKFFKILEYQSSTSHEPFIKKMNEGSPEFKKYRWITHLPWFKDQKPSQLFAYEIFNKTSEGKPTVLVWAKEHGDELYTSEFVVELSKFFLWHLEGNGTPALNKVVQQLFSNLNMIVVPDMTPDKNFQTFKNKTTTREDFNGLGVLLQPFDYDSENPDTYIMAPEAFYLKQLILNTPHLVLGVDVHDPFGTSVIAGPERSVGEINRYLIAEANHTSKCILNLRELEQIECKTGQFMVAHPQISGATENAPSFFSRTLLAPSILLELDTARPDNVPFSSECQYGYKEDSTCEVYIQGILQHGIPYFLRLLEITSVNAKIKNQESPSIFYSFINRDSAKGLLKKPDKFLSQLSEIDIRLRAGSKNINSRKEFIDFLGEQASDWQPAEKLRIQVIVKWIENRIQTLKLNFKIPKINFVKTTGEEEASLPYTRGNSIILPLDILNSQDLLSVISHELFHIWLKNHPERRPEFYQIFNYRIIESGSAKTCPNYETKISNPDIEVEDAAISLNYKGTLYTAIPLILNREGKKVSSDSNLRTNFLFNFCLKAQSDDSIQFTINADQTNYADLVGSDADQNYHPDELLAEQFAILLASDLSSLPSPNYVSVLEQLLHK